MKAIRRTGKAPGGELGCGRTSSKETAAVMGDKSPKNTAKTTKQKTDHKTKAPASAPKK